MTWFVEKHATAYLAPTREIFAQALTEGIKKDQLYLTGRPVRRQFRETLACSRVDTLQTLGLDPARFTIFLRGGAKGSAGVDQILRHIMQRNMPIQVILATGNNQAMAEQYAHTRHVSVLPFTEVIAPAMAAVDMVAGKAGASFITEALPFLVTTLIPGQETPSLRFIERYNLGWVCLRTSAQIELLAKLTCNPAMLAEKVSSIRAYKDWNIKANQGLKPLIDRLLS
jgi:UDP-N-acetylglucosamine:LPS N-acetylglucosamine transferase